MQIKGFEVETWDTRFGLSVRSVQRDPQGRFVTNKSATQLAQRQIDVDPYVFLKEVK